MKLNNNDDSHNSGLNLLIYNMLLDIGSHPAWVCGLKHNLQIRTSQFFLSHPAWVCGLKLHTHGRFFSFLMSHPAWVCGLKRATEYLQRWKEVTPCVGVWIET